MRASVHCRPAHTRSSMSCARRTCSCRVAEEYRPSSTLPNTVSVTNLLCTTMTLTHHSSSIAELRIQPSLNASLIPHTQQNPQAAAAGSDASAAGTSPQGGSGLVATSPSAGGAAADGSASNVQQAASSSQAGGVAAESSSGSNAGDGQSAGNGSTSGAAAANVAATNPATMG